MPDRLNLNRLSIAEWAVGGFTLGYMVLWLALAVAYKNEEFVFYFVIMCLLVIVVTTLHFKVQLSLGALWGLAWWGLAHMAGGLATVPSSWPTQGESHVLYNLWLVPGWLKYDQLVHAYGFGLVTWICWQTVVRQFARHSVTISPNIGLLLLCVAAGMGFGALNEVVEFVATLLLPGTNVGGYQNTGWDLVANLIGCTLAAGAIAAFASRLKN